MFLNRSKCPKENHGGNEEFPSSSFCCATLKQRKQTCQIFRSCPCRHSGARTVEQVDCGSFEWDESDSKDFSKEEVKAELGRRKGKPRISEPEINLLAIPASGLDKVSIRSPARMASMDKNPIADVSASP